MRRVVVTGLGMVTPLACGVEQTWQRLLAGESGIKRIERFEVSDITCKIAGQVPIGDAANDHFNADDFVPPKDQRKMDQFIVFALAAGVQAVQDSGWMPKDEESRERCSHGLKRKRKVADSMSSAWRLESDSTRRYGCTSGPGFGGWPLHPARTCPRGVVQQLRAPRRTPGEAANRGAAKEIEK